ncbi:Scaffold-type E3 ligase [Friedmanniomyces endolithicus]|uniref:Defective in cullin neddylation protein n=1 Tax=Friedmanniomyces endolithicus TaxID=329885 RepID=A0AAN6FJJ7_9PEZI|nr:Scaffold-type E3 ligase [Friedmanniomyces endolithicus]KAK0283029.1 Scaffold-type E3 ligase [Friedmanniomyces endolithicus]KAK0318330.1 Scaffold-type E3 ligase [Friedmanniomyces endolithicus]KAK0927499.1 Scaffold-type E3 ligase [Friedmanniomyces endolithicus]KAK0986495.1 Scaffold-type E3 ligase [Friedmanniomyces endolithicus]
MGKRKSDAMDTVPATAMKKLRVASVQKKKAETPEEKNHLWRKIAGLPTFPIRSTPRCSSPSKEETLRCHYRNTCALHLHPLLLPRRHWNVNLAMPAIYSSAQKAAIAEFTSVTQVDKSSAAKLLKQHNWNASAAVNAVSKDVANMRSFFNNPSTAAANPLRKSLNSTFDKYRDDPRNEPDNIDVGGTSKLLGQLQIELDDVGALIFSDIVSSPSLGKITREGFVDGWAEVNIDSLPKMRNLVLQRRSALPSDRDIFKNVYNHTFTLALAPGAKTLPLEMAVEFWRMLFTPPAYDWRTSGTPWLDWWLEFLPAKKTKAVNKDLWKQTLSFAEQTMRDDSLSFWNEESSWPSVIDEFVEWIRKEKRPGGGGEAMEVE